MSCVLIGAQQKYFGNCRGARHRPWGWNRGPRCSPVGFRICDKVHFGGLACVFVVLGMLCGVAVWFFVWLSLMFVSFGSAHVVVVVFASCCFLFVAFCCFLLCFIGLFWTLSPLFCSSRPPILFIPPAYMPDCLPTYLTAYLPSCILLPGLFCCCSCFFFLLFCWYFFTCCFAVFLACLFFFDLSIAL